MCGPCVATVASVVLLCCISVVASQTLRDTVHGTEDNARPFFIRSPNNYYLEYTKLLHGQAGAPAGVYLRHPALPLRPTRTRADLLRDMYAVPVPVPDKGQPGSDGKYGRDRGAGEDKGRATQRSRRCKDMMMRDQHTRMSTAQMSMMCEMYQQWGDSMSQDMGWKPSESQKRWWNSLGMKAQMDRMQEGGSGRQKRQTTAGRERARRKEYRALSDNERARFHHAVNVLKNSYMDGESKYDMFVRYHQAKEAPGAHFGPAFLGWHRELLLR